VRVVVPVQHAGRPGDALLDPLFRAVLDAVDGPAAYAAQPAVELECPDWEADVLPQLRREFGVRDAFVERALHRCVQEESASERPDYQRLAKRLRDVLAAQQEA
jgi:hypothetical protein